MWDMMTDIFNEWDKVKIVWVPGHIGIEGNKLADGVAKGMINRRLDMNGRWKEADYEENSKSLIKG